MIKYVCDVCGKSFVMSESIKARSLHMGDVTKIRSVDICKECNKELNEKIAVVEYLFYKRKKGEVVDGDI